MPEVGLVRFGQALDVAQATVPRYRTAFSKHQFTQPLLLAILCLMRYEGWTFREAEVRLAEHSELRRALGLRSVPDYFDSVPFPAAAGRSRHHSRFA